MREIILSNKDRLDIHSSTIYKGNIFMDNIHDEVYFWMGYDGLVINFDNDGANIAGVDII